MTEISDLKQAKAEIRKWTIDFTDDLPSAVTVASAIATHTPPSGVATVPTVLAASPYVHATLPAQSVTGLHILDILATYSDAQKSAVRLNIEIPF